MLKVIGLIIVIVVVLAVVFAPSEEERKKESATLPTSVATYQQLNSEVGCKSKDSDDKKADVFKSQYKDHWMTWSGKIVLLEADNVSLDMDGGTQDLMVKFADKKTGYDLKKDVTVTVKFVMRNAGGCFLPFSGDFAELVK